MVLKRFLVILFSAAALFLLIRSSLILIEISRDGGDILTSSQGGVPGNETVISEKKQEIAGERAFYLMPPYDDFLDVADAIVETVDRHRLDIASYSLMDQDSRPGIELAVEGPIQNILACLDDLETMPYYLDIPRMDAGRKSGDFSGSLLIFPARPGESPGAFTEDDGIIDVLALARAVFGVRAPPEIPVEKEDHDPPPGFWISVIGGYAAAGGSYVYALRDDRTGRIVPMQVGESRGEWRLVSDEDSLLVVEAEGETHILEWRSGG